MTKIGIIIGSTRPGRKAETVARWVHGIASQRTDAEFELVDLKDFDLPHLDEEIPASRGVYAKAHTQAWARAVDAYDGYVFVTPEYNHSTSGALKNAIDFVYKEWTNKAAGIVSYGAVGGARAAEHLRLVLGELQVADVRAQVALSLFTDFEDFTVLTPSPFQEQQLGVMLDQVVAWSRALRSVREPAAVA